MLKALAMLIVAFLKRASLLDDDGFVWQAGTPAEPDHRPLRAEFELGALAPAPTRAELLERVKAPYLAPLFEKQDA
jgi:hypothetical protein